MSDDRFMRQADLVNMEALVDTACTIVGCGAIGRNVALQLAAMGAPKVMLVDFDRVEDHNRTTQGFRHRDLGAAKVVAVKEVMLELDPEMTVVLRNRRFRTSDLADETAKRVAVFACVDTMTARRQIFEAWRTGLDAMEAGHETILIDGRMLAWRMQVLAATMESIEVEKYEKSLYSDDEAVGGRCTGRATLAGSQIAAGMMTFQFANWLAGTWVDPSRMLYLPEGLLLDGGERVPVPDDREVA